MKPLGGHVRPNEDPPTIVLGSSHDTSGCGTAPLPGNLYGPCGERATPPSAPGRFPALPPVPRVDSRFDESDGLACRARRSHLPFGGAEPMKRRVALVLLLTPVLTAPAFAGIFFNSQETGQAQPGRPRSRADQDRSDRRRRGQAHVRRRGAARLRPDPVPGHDAGADRRAAQRQEARRPGRGGPEPRQDPAGLRPGGHGPGAVAGQGRLDARALAGPQRPVPVPLERLEGAGAEEGRDADGPAEGPAADPEQGTAAGAAARPERPGLPQRLAAAAAPAGAAGGRRSVPAGRAATAGAEPAAGVRLGEPERATEEVLLRSLTLAARRGSSIATASA